MRRAGTWRICCSSSAWSCSFPGLLTLTDLAAAVRPRVAYAARVLVLIGATGISAIFVAEMLAGRLGTGSAAATEDLLDAMFSWPIAGPMIPAMLAFFVGAALFAPPLIAGSGPLRWPAGTLLILAEVISSQVLLSQIGNLLIWGGTATFAWLVVRGEAGVRDMHPSACACRCRFRRWSLV